MGVWDWRRLGVQAAEGYGSRTQGVGLVWECGSVWRLGAVLTQWVIREKQKSCEFRIGIWEASSKCLGFWLVRSDLKHL